MSLQPRLQSASVLVSFGADVNSKDEKGMTPLMLAARAGNFEVVEFLLKAGSDPNARDAEGYTVLHHAVLGAVERAKKLEEKEYKERIGFYGREHKK